jgi:predicted nucleic acid-binding Zn ribbon protein
MDTKNWCCICGTDIPPNEKNYCKICDFILNSYNPEKRGKMEIDISELMEKIEIMKICFSEIWEDLENILSEKQIKEIKEKHENKIKIFEL